MNLNATLFAQLVVFFILAWFTMKFVWPPVIAALDERASRVAEGIENFEAAKVELSRAKQSAKEELESAKSHAHEIRLVAQHQASLILEKAHAEAELIVSSARARAQQETIAAKDNMIEGLRADLSRLVLVGVEKIVGESVDLERHAALVKRLESEL